MNAKGTLHSFENLGEMEAELEKDTHAAHVLGEVRGQKKKFRKTPRLRRGDSGGACRVYGSIEGNKVQGDFHITARGHGYWDFGEHLSHNGISISPFLWGVYFPASAFSALRLTFCSLLTHLSHLRITR